MRDFIGGGGGVETFLRDFLVKFSAIRFFFGGGGGAITVPFCRRVFRNRLLTRSILGHRSSELTYCCKSILAVAAFALGSFSTRLLLNGLALVWCA